MAISLKINVNPLFTSQFIPLYSVGVAEVNGVNPVF